MHWPSIFLYMSSSFMIVIFNKILLSHFEFPSIPYLMFWQSVVSSFFFASKSPEKPNLTVLLAATANTVNIFFGLNAASGLNVAMFTALRRISILMTMVLQWYLLKSSPKKLQIISIITMVAGSFLAAANDLAFNAHGYIFVMLNNVMTALSQIITKKALGSKSKECLLLYSAMMGICVSSVGSFQFRPEKWSGWYNNGFRLAFVGSILLGLVINWAATWVIEKNDALTLAVAGSTKSAVMGLVVCMGLFDSTYIFSWPNFIGLQISTVASFMYVYSKRPPSACAKPRPPITSKVDLV